METTPVNEDRPSKKAQLRLRCSMHYLIYFQVIQRSATNDVVIKSQMNMKVSGVTFNNKLQGLFLSQML